VLHCKQPCHLIFNSFGETKSGAKYNWVLYLINLFNILHSNCLIFLIKILVFDSMKLTLTFFMCKSHCFQELVHLLYNLWCTLLLFNYASHCPWIISNLFIWDVKMYVCINFQNMQKNDEGEKREWIQRIILYWSFLWFTVTHLVLRVFLVAVVF
jgi:hypothetical protein